MNSDKYKQAFSGVHASKEIDLEEIIMTNKKSNMNWKTVLLTCTIVVICAGITVFATDTFGIKGTVTAWIKGDQQEVEYVINDDNKVDIYLDGELYDTFWCNDDEQVTSEKIEYLANRPDLEIADDGKVYVRYKDQLIDVTEEYAKGYLIVSVPLDDGTACHFILMDNDTNTIPSGKMLQLNEDGTHEFIVIEEDAAE